MLINDYQGIPSLPDPTDDELITSQGMFPQPSSRTSVLAGFVSLSKVFKILSECFFHHRLVTSNLNHFHSGIGGGGHGSGGGSGGKPIGVAMGGMGTATGNMGTSGGGGGGGGMGMIGIEWTLQAEENLHNVLREMPEVIQDPNMAVTQASRQVFGMQRANILITAAICKFALVSHHHHFTNSLSSLSPFSPSLCLSSHLYLVLTQYEIWV